MTLWLCLQEDVSLSGYQKHVSSCSAPAPLTAAEQELQQIRINEVGVQQMMGVQQGWMCSRGGCAAGMGVQHKWVSCRGGCAAALGEEPEALWTQTVEGCRV